MAVTDRGPLPVPLPLRADDPVDLLLQQLPEHTEPDLDRQRQQPLPRRPHQLPQRLLHALREHGLIVDRLSDRYVALHGGSSFDLGRIAHHAPTRSGRAGGTAVTSKFYEPRDNLGMEHNPKQADRLQVPSIVAVSKQGGLRRDFGRRSPAGREPESDLAG